MRSTGGTLSVSKQDKYLLDKYKWRCRKDGYVYACFDGKTIYLHRLIMQPKEGMVVDHINGDPSDNRRSNLRVVTQQQNILNNRATGAYWDKERKRWCVYLKKNYKTIFVGRYKTKAEALRERAKALRKLFPEYAASL